MATSAMKEIYPFLNQCAIFNGIPEEKFPNVLRCLQAHKKTFPKGSTILHIGELCQTAGVVLTGRIELIFYDEAGNQVNVNHISSGEIFGSELACSQQGVSPIQLRTQTRCEVLFLNYAAILNVGDPPCPYRSQVCANLLRELSRQTLFLNCRLRILSQKRLRDKIKVYLQAQTFDAEGRVTLPFSRNEMADFLYADRSALSRELGRMREEGILRYQGQRFQILDPAFLSV